MNKYELEELGDVKDKYLLRLQCYFGLDTLSFSRLGAKCTGIDISSEGIKKAKLLNDELGLNASFIESNLCDVPKKVNGKFDIVFTSYGVIGWLPDLKTQAEIITSKLKKTAFSDSLFYNEMNYYFNSLLIFSFSSSAKAPSTKILPLCSSVIIFLRLAISTCL